MRIERIVAIHSFPFTQQEPERLRFARAYRIQLGTSIEIDTRASQFTLIAYYCGELRVFRLTYWAAGFEVLDSIPELDKKDFLWRRLSKVAKYGPRILIIRVSVIRICDYPNYRYYYYYCITKTLVDAIFLRILIFFIENMYKLFK